MSMSDAMASPLAIPGLDVAVSALRVRVDVGVGVVGLSSLVQDVRGGRQPPASVFEPEDQREPGIGGRRLGLEHLIGGDGEIQSAELTPAYAALRTWEPALGKLRARRIAQKATENDRGARNATPTRFSGPGFTQRSYGGANRGRSDLRAS